MLTFAPDGFAMLKFCARWWCDASNLHPVVEECLILVPDGGAMLGEGQAVGMWSEMSIVGNEMVRMSANIAWSIT
jgi:hypothetical protein